MPLPRRLARFNRHATNRFFGLFAGRLPPWAIVHHRGRVTGRPYATPVTAFRRHGGFVVPLTYGAASTEWVANVLAAGGCVLERAGERIELGEPQVVTGHEGRHPVPAIVRPALRLLRADALLLRR